MGHSDISVLAVELGMDGHAVGSNRIDRVLTLLSAIQEQQAPEDATKTLLELAERRLRDLAYQTSEDSPGAILRRALQADGYALSDDHLIPAEPAAIPVQAAVSALEAELNAGFPTALVHYRQAVENYVRGNYEAANGQVRSCLEDFFITLCDRRAGKIFDEASAALQHLRGLAWLDDGE